MKAKIIMTLLVALSISISCNDNLGGSSSTPDCDWGKDEKLAFDKIQLKVPGGMNNWWRNQFPEDNVIKDLWSVMLTKGNYSGASNKAQVSGNVVGGQGCKGVKGFVYKNDDPKIQSKSLKAPFPNNGFVVEATVFIRSDDFYNDGSGGSAYFVLWRRQSNKFPLSGNITGVKNPYYPDSGKVSKEKGYIIKSDEKNYY